MLSRRNWALVPLPSRSFQSHLENPEILAQIQALGIYIHLHHRSLHKPQKILWVDMVVVDSGKSVHVCLSKFNLDLFLILSKSYLDKVRIKTR